MNNFKKPETLKQEEEEEKVKQTKSFAFDKVFEGEEEMTNPQDYCKKCKYESQWCKHRKDRKDSKNIQSAVVTT